MKKDTLTEAELQVMKCIWDADCELGLGEIVKRVNDKFHRNWKPQTASTFLSRLVQKQFLELKRDGRYYTYQILVKEEDYMNKQMSEFSQFWGKHSASKFVAALLESRDLSKKDIEELRDLLDEFDN